MVKSLVDVKDGCDSDGIVREKATTNVAEEHSSGEPERSSENNSLQNVATLNTGSPIRPMDDQAEPMEAAHGLSEPSTPEVGVASRAATKADNESEELFSVGEAVADVGGLFITDEMVEEEKKLKLKTTEEEEKIRKELQEKQEQELKEQRFNRLLHLLNRSQFYTDFLLKKMESQSEAQKKKLQEQARSRQKKLEKQQHSLKPVESSVSTRARTNTSQATHSQEASIKKSRKDLSSSKAQDLSDEENLTPNVQKAKRNEGANNLDPSSQATEKKRVKQSEIGVKRRMEESVYNIADVISKESVCKRTKVQPSEDHGVSSDKPEDTFSRTIDGQPVSDRQPLLFVGGIMRPYQLDGYEWLSILFENGVNGILADEMGLGKTIQCIALICHLVEMKVIGPFLICAPLSTLPNWISEFQRFAPKIPVLLYHGTKETRQGLRRRIKTQVPVNDVLIHPIVVTSYEIIMNDRRELEKFEWRYIIVDEGHRIKNFKCRLIQELKKYRAVNSLLLTGTPLQNNLSELWSLLNFLLPEIFDDLAVFESWFDVKEIEGGDATERIIAQEQENKILSTLHQILTPFLLRRIKSDVDLQIPSKKELLVYAPLSKKQEELYRKTVDKTIADKLCKEEEKVELDEKGRPKRSVVRKINYAVLALDETEAKTEAAFEKQMQELSETTKQLQSQKVTTSKQMFPKTSILNIKMKNSMMQLRRCVNHPYLIDYPLLPNGELKVDEDLIKHCGKLQVLDIMLRKLKQREHKVLIFSQMTKLLDILEDYVLLRGYRYSRLDGSMDVMQRQENIDRFNTDPEVFLFLLSTRAGGLGINLSAADTVIIYDSDWNPQQDLQAQDRCHRIGQTKPVVVYRLVTANTIDEKIVERAAAKRKLEKMIIHKAKFKSGVDNIRHTLEAVNPQDLLELLNSQDHSGVVKKPDGKVFTEKELDMLLDRSDMGWHSSEDSQRKKVKKTGKKAVTARRDELQGVFRVVDEEGLQGMLI